MGYKGDSYMDSGYFFAPYVPITSTPVVLPFAPIASKKKNHKAAGRPMFQPFPESKHLRRLGLPKRRFRSIDDPWEASNE